MANEKTGLTKYTVLCNFCGTMVNASKAYDQGYQSALNEQKRTKEMAMANEMSLEDAVDVCERAWQEGEWPLNTDEAIECLRKRYPRKSPGRVAYEARTRHIPGEGRWLSDQIRRWEDLSDQIRCKWELAAQAVIDQYRANNG